MNLYMFAQKDDYDNILTEFGIDKNEIPRLRGIQVVVKDEYYYLHIHTRTWGWNREWYQEENNKMQKNKFFVTDHDDSFDSTYADWFFIKKKDDENPVQNAENLLNSLLYE